MFGKQHSLNKIATKKDIKVFKKSFMETDNNHLFGAVNNTPLGVSYSLKEIGSNTNVLFFGGDTEEGRKAYEDYVAVNLKQDNCSNIIVTDKPITGVSFDYIINVDTYNPLDYLYRFYKKEDKLSFFLNLDKLYNCLDVKDGFDPFHITFEKTVLCLLICYVIENDKIQDKNFDSVITLLKRFKNEDSENACSEDIANGKSPTINELYSFYENNSEKWGSDYWKGFELRSCYEKTLTDIVLNYLVILQEFTTACTSSIDFNELIKEKKNILIRLAPEGFCSLNRISLYKMFFSQLLDSRYSYGDLFISKTGNRTAYSDAIHTQIYFDSCELAGNLIKAYSPVLHTGGRYGIGISIYYEDLKCFASYDRLPTEFFMQIFHLKSVDEECVLILQDIAKKHTINRMYGEFYRKHPNFEGCVRFCPVTTEAFFEKDIVKFAENNKQIAFVEGFYPIICNPLNSIKDR